MKSIRLASFVGLLFLTASAPASAQQARGVRQCPTCIITGATASLFDLTLRRPSLAAVETPGLHLSNPTASTGGVQNQLPPLISFDGATWMGSNTPYSLTFGVGLRGGAPALIARILGADMFTLTPSGNFTVPGVIAAESFAAIHAPSVDTLNTGVLALGPTSASGVQVGKTAGQVGLYGVSPVAQQTTAALTNSVSGGGSPDVIADFTSLTTYATDAATIRNDIYQLARKVAQLEAELVVIGVHKH